MNKILLIVEREYLTRVRKKSFLIMTLIGPLLFAGIMVVPAWLATMNGDEKNIQVLDQSGAFTNKLKAQRNVNFTYVKGSIEELKAGILAGKADGLLIIPALDLDKPVGVQLFFQKSPSLEIENNIAGSIEDELENRKLIKNGIDRSVLENLKPNVDIDTKQLSAEGEKDSSSAGATITGFASAFLIYFFIFLYGVQVMRGVIEEKTSRIVEVIISSVKPFELMMGKILGVALVGLTQFLLWVALSSGISFVASQLLASNSEGSPATTVAANTKTALQGAEKAGAAPKLTKGLKKENISQKISNALGTVDFVTQIICFVFYFIGGYLLYSSLFAAVGAAVDSETDTQQFMLPITIPLILSIIVAQGIINDPESKLAFWMSIIPFTSPVVMMVRLPFHPPLWEVLLSMALLVLGFIGTVWFAGRIYRVGILMYGKKVNYREISKWLFYKV